MITARSYSEERRGSLWIETAVIVGGAALIFGAAEVAVEWRQPLRQTVEIDLSAWALPKYALFSLARGWIAYFFSLLFTLLIIKSPRRDEQREQQRKEVGDPTAREGEERVFRQGPR